MATMPDLPTSNIGTIGYWNATDHGVGSIDPSEVLSYSFITEYTSYDNGITGTLSFGSGMSGNRDWGFRAKGDGWVIVYVDRQDVEGVSENKTLRGQYDIILDIADQRNDVGSTPLPQSNLQDKIFGLAGELSNSSNMTFNAGDVGYYCYKFSNATTLHQISEFAKYNEGFFGSVSYTSDTDRYYHYAAGAKDNDTDELGFVNAGNVIPTTSGERPQGALDVLGAGITPNSGVGYQNRRDGANQAGMTITHVIFHS